MQLRKLVRRVKRFFGVKPDLSSGTKRLYYLIDYMRENHERLQEHFNMTSWADHRGGGVFEKAFQEGDARGDEVYLKPSVLYSCNTTACALGTAACIPEFHAMGLRLVVPVEWREGWVALLPGHGFSRGADRSHFAGELFFELNSCEVEKLFSCASAQNINTVLGWCDYAEKKLQEWHRVRT